MILGFKLKEERGISKSISTFTSGLEEDTPTSPNMSSASEPAPHGDCMGPLKVRHFIRSRVLSKCFLNSQAANRSTR